VEKPFAMNEREARKMIKAAKKKVCVPLLRGSCGKSGDGPVVAVDANCSPPFT